jgi:hypothetical protein
MNVFLLREGNVQRVKFDGAKIMVGAQVKQFQGSLDDIQRRK